MQAERTAPTRYFEVDFKEVTKRKAAVIANRDVLHQMVSGKVSPQDIGTCEVLQHQTKDCISPISNCIFGGPHWTCSIESVLMCMQNKGKS